MSTTPELSWVELSTRPDCQRLAGNAIKLCSEMWVRHEKLFNDISDFLNTSQLDEETRDRILDRLHRVFNGIEFFAYKEGDPEKVLLTIEQFLEKTQLEYDNKLGLNCGTIGHNYDLLTEIKANADVLVMLVATHAKKSLIGAKLMADITAFGDGNIQELLQLGLTYQRAIGQELPSNTR